MMALEKGRGRRVSAMTATLIAALAAGCSSPSGSTGGAGGDSGNGGSTGAGGMTGAGGTTGAGGAGAGQGGATGSGGAGGGSGGASGAGGADGGTMACPSISDFASWPAGKGPLDIGRLATTDFKTHI